jgi:hypothetical protein
MKKTPIDPERQKRRKAIVKDLIPDLEASEHEYKQMERCFDEFLDLFMELEDEENEEDDTT